jgi:hypothetical protein
MKSNSPPDATSSTGATCGIGKYILPMTPAQKNTELRRACVIAICLGHLPLDIASNMGLRYLLVYMNKKTGLPTGISARMIGRELILLYKEMVLEKQKALLRIRTDFRKAFFTRLGIVRAEEQEFLCRPFNMIHDGWSRKHLKDNYLGSSAVAMDVTSRPWRLEFISFGCFPFVGTKGAENAYELLSDISSIFKFDLSKETNSATQDCTGSSFNVFRGSQFCARIPCFAHRANTHLKWAVSKCSVLSDFFDALDTIQVTIGGTSKRLELFEESQKRICARDKKAFVKLSFIKPATTRWNERQRQAERYLETHFRDATEALNASDLFTSGSSQEKAKQLNKFNAARRTVASLAVVASKVLVYLKLVAQWTQVLSSKNWFTMSLVVVACNELVSCLKNLSDDATKLVSSELLDDQVTGKYVPNLLGTNYKLRTY